MIAGVATVSIVHLGATDLSRRGDYGTVVYDKCSFSQKERTWLQLSSNIMLTFGRHVNCINNIVMFPVCMDTQLDIYNILLPLVIPLHTAYAYNSMDRTVHTSMSRGHGSLAYFSG